LWDSGNGLEPSYEKMSPNAGFAGMRVHPMPEMPQQALVSEK